MIATSNGSSINGRLSRLISSDGEPRLLNAPFSARFRTPALFILQVSPMSRNNIGKRAQMKRDS